MTATRRILFLLILCLPGALYAQQQGSIKGVVYRAGSPQRLAQAVISNLHTGSVIITDERGIFSIKGSSGDTLLITRKGYISYRQPVTGTADLLIYLNPGTIELNEVKITGQSKREELSDIMRSYRGQGTYFNGKPPAMLFLNSPVTGLYELFGATPRRARHFAAFTRAELEQDEVNKRYNKEFVKRITALPDGDAQKFMDYYTPSFDDMQTWNDYELIKHVKRQLEYYKKNAGRSSDFLQTTPSLLKPEHIRVDTGAAPTVKQ